MSHPRLIRLFSMALGFALLTMPISALSPGVSAPAPVSQAADRTATYLYASALMDGLSLTQTQKTLLWSRMDAELLLRLKQGNLSPSQLDYLTQPHYRSALSTRYEALAALHPTLSPEQIVTAVNLNQDRDFYTIPQPIDAPHSLTVLVNKHHSLDAAFVPTLEVLGSGYGKGALHPEAARQFRAMADAAHADGIVLRSVSAYRSYATQRYTYNNYLSQYSQATVDTFSARPGHSEHQTGLALDINVARTSAHFENTPAYAWLLEHCAEFGFILRYPPGKEHLTGYRFEPWHYRYVGTEIAAVCMEQGLTYEEYTAQLPAAGATAVPRLYWQGTKLDFLPLMLDGEPYASACGLSQALGISTQRKGIALQILRADSVPLTLSPGLYAMVGGAAQRLHTPVLALEGDLYIHLENLPLLFGPGFTSQ